MLTSQEQMQALVTRCGTAGILLFVLFQAVQVVVPVTSQPLVLPMRILRSERASDGEYVYAGCFVGMVREEENMVREAVFSIQLKVTEQENPALEKGC